MTLEEVIFKFILPKWVSFRATVMGRNAASAAGNSRNEDLRIGSDRSRSGNSGSITLYFVFCFALFLVSY